MCGDKECPIKETCYRFTAKSSRYQSYFCKSPREIIKDTKNTIVGFKCEYYWEAMEEISDGN